MAGLQWWGRRLLDLGGYAVGLTVVVTAVLAALSLLAGAGWNGVKLGLFLVGTLAFGYATYLRWPSRPPQDLPARRPEERDEQRQGSTEGPTVRTGGGPPEEDADRSQTPFEAVLDRLPPLLWTDLPPVERFHPGTKLYAASLLMLAVSYAMEALFGVRA